MGKKILVLVPDGVSLRNFAYTSFYQLGIQQGNEVIFWNATPFDLDGLGYKQILIRNPKLHWLTDILKAARIRIELRLFAKRDSDPIYDEYIFPLSTRNFKSSVKSLIIRTVTSIFSSEKGLEKLRLKIIELERKTSYYDRCKDLLVKEKPDLVFCASQRAVTSIAPLTAAQDLDIPTVAFIFSWDNVPKATTVVTADFYFVWSEHMKRELLHYQRYISEDQIKVTGTPQFESHFDAHRRISREEFCKEHDLDPDFKYICFSGDDITTSPKDELYLRDVAMAVRTLNEKGMSLKIIYRKCPVDFTIRYDKVLAEFKDVIADIPPAWQKIGEGWNTVLPLPSDLDLQANIIAHTEGVINLASSMVFDYICQGKPCAYMNYNYLNPEEKPMKGVYIYDYVHFRSMPSSKAVVWLQGPDTISGQLKEMLSGLPVTLSAAGEWFKVINTHPPKNASKRIWEELNILMLKDIN